MTELSPRARDLFARARASGAPTAAERARVLERVERAVTPSVPPPPAPALPMLGVSAIVIAAVLLSVLGTPSPTHAPAPIAPARVVTAPIAPVPTLAPTPTPTLASTPAPPPTRTVALDPLTEELRLLRRAQSARRAHRWPSALAALREHQTRFPDGVLASERDVARALVLCESGHRDEGRVVAAPFAGSAWAASLDEACASVDSIALP